MKQPQHSIDGFIPRRPSSRTNYKSSTDFAPKNSSETLSSSQPIKSASESIGLSRSNSFSRNDIDESLKSIRSEDAPKQKKTHGLRGFVRTRKKRIAKWVAIVLTVFLVLIGAWLGVRFLIVSGNIFKGNILGLVQSKPLKEDANGRSNILVLGTSEDDPGHGGAYLTDSMMVVSIDQKGKTASMFSIPRDLYVEYGRACNSGIQGKINEYFNCVNDDYSSKEAEEERITKTREFVGGIFGIDVQYGVHVNNTVIKDAVDAVGGIDVDIQGSGGAPGILDRNFDWRCNYTCHLVKYDNGVHHLDGKRALFLAQARGDVAPTYGLGNSNFDREKNQQKIIIALKKKAVSSGTLANVGKVTGLLDALGDNLRTNFDSSEIRTLVGLGKDIPTESIHRLSLVEDDEAVVTSGNYNGASVVMPTAGVFNYTEIRSYLQQKLSSSPLVREQAIVDIYNGSGVPGTAQTEADKLSEKGYTIGTITNAPAGSYEAVEIYQIGEGNSATKSGLKEEYGVTVLTTTPPVTVTGETKFVVIIGKQRVIN